MDRYRPRLQTPAVAAVAAEIREEQEGTISRAEGEAAGPAEAPTGGTCKPRRARAAPPGSRVRVGAPRRRHLVVVVGQVAAEAAVEVGEEEEEEHRRSKRSDRGSPYRIPRQRS